MPGDENLTTRTAETMDGALFELKLVGDIAGWFRVARYQRGYRWGSLEVERLLNDIWECRGQPETGRHRRP
jgi:uncharacterized protein with ParB-like and HNH nuclease domain